MRRDWLTLAFGIALVGAVVALSLRQNMSDTSAPRPAIGTERPAPAAPTTPTPVPGVTSGTAPASEPPSAPVPGTSSASRSRARTATPGSGAAAPTAAPIESGVLLQVQSDVPGASVFLDREFVGATPLTLKGLTAGSKQLNVTATGHDGYAETIELKEGTNRVNVEFQRVRLNASIPVVHRHTMGSCQGTLTASVKGITYDTSNKPDAFSLTFADLEEFEVDYLKKNLRVRRRGGKTWNFTNDSADALFVFHRDVNKAREKLAAAR
jgi:hypothetical protein